MMPFPLMSDEQKHELLMALMIYFVCRYEDGMEQIHAAVDTVEVVGQEMASKWESEPAI